MRIREIALCLLLLFGFAAALPAQEITGNISGTVTDTSGAAMPDAKVDLSSVLTGAERSTTTTSAGIFFFTSLPVGDYTLIVSKDGFKKSEVTGIHVNVNDKLTFTIKLALGAVTESVTVTSEVAVLQTESAEVSNLIGNNQMKSLPLNQRDFGQLVDLVPGVAPDNGRVGINDTSVSVNGNQSNSNLYLVDGTFDEDNGNNGSFLVKPSVDAIEEFKILRNNYSPESGEATGAIINVVTKSGGQNFHGSLFEFLRNNKLDASDPLVGPSGFPRSTTPTRRRISSFSPPSFPVKFVATPSLIPSPLPGSELELWTPTALSHLRKYHHYPALRSRLTRKSS